MLRGKWWEIYQDPQLNQLEERIDATNNQASARRWRLISPRATRSRCPRHTLSHALRRALVSRDQSFSQPAALQSSGKPPPTATYELTGQASWEPDFWGRIRRTVEAARENAQATQR